MKHLLVVALTIFLFNKASSQNKPIEVTANAAKQVGESISVSGEIHGLKVVPDSVMFYLARFTPNQTMTVVLISEALASYKHTDPGFKFTRITANGKIIKLENKPAIVVSKSKDYQLLGDR